MRRQVANKTTKLSTAFIAVICMIFSLVVTQPAHATPSTVSTYQELSDAIVAAGTNPAEIQLAAGFPVDSTITIPAGAQITLKPADSGVKLTRGAALGRSPILYVEKGGNLSLDPSTTGGVITADNEQQTGPIVHVAGEMTLNDGVITGMKGLGNIGKLSFHRHSPTGGMAAFVVAGPDAKLTMNGGKITKNIATNGSTYGVQDAAANLEVMNQATFLLKAGEISQGQVEGVYPYYAGPGVRVTTGAQMRMDGGKITQNQSNFAGGIMLHSGDILYWEKPSDLEKWKDETLHAKLTINGGEISDNFGMQGGGISIWGKSSVVMESGSIVRNKAGFGGGVFTMDGFINGKTKRMPDGSVVPYGITHNSGSTILIGKDRWPDANEIPKDILIEKSREWTKLVPASFEMNGGVIDSNQAAAHGGGINPVSNGVVINRGKITNNTSAAMGGGIYVSVQPYTLYVKNVAITSNTAQLGGGLWNCPTGHSILHINDGGAIFDNTAAKAGTAMSIDPVGIGSDGPPREQYVAERALGGSKPVWYLDNADARHDGATPGVPFDLSLLQTDPRYRALANEMTDDGKKAAENLAQVVISGNKAAVGGGIGSNGNVIIGTGNDHININVTKKWDNTDQSATLPDSLMVRLKVDGKLVVDQIKLDATNNWSATFTRLPMCQTIKGQRYPLKYVVEEITPNGWVPVANQSEFEVNAATLEADSTATVAFENKPTTPPTPPTPTVPPTPQVPKKLPKTGV